MNATGELVLDDETDDTPAPHKAKPQRAEVFAEPLPMMKPPPPVLPAVPGVPDVEGRDEVKAQRARYAAARAEFDRVRAERIELGAKLGLRPGEHNPGKIERIAARMLADGQDTADVERFERLAVQERRLLMALEMIIPDITAALEKARREIRPAALRDLLDPAQRAVALARLELARAVKARDDAIWRLQLCGLQGGPGVGGSTAPAYEVAEWVKLGFITQAEAAAAAEFLS